MTNFHKIIISIIAIAIVATGLYWYSAREEGVVQTNPGWKTFTSMEEGVTFEYPDTLSTSYIHTVDWPPKVNVASGPFTCVEAGSEVLPAGQTQKRIVGNRTYCVTKESEGAAGSMYILYSYTFLRNGQMTALTFSLRFSQCGNYDDSEKTACENERNAFDIDGIVDRIAESVRNS